MHDTLKKLSTEFSKDKSTLAGLASNKSTTIPNVCGKMVSSYSREVIPTRATRQYVKVAGIYRSFRNPMRTFRTKLTTDMHIRILDVHH